MRIEQTLSFKKDLGKLHKNQRHDLDSAIRTIRNDPRIGQQKKGELSEVRVYKFKMTKLLTLLAYIWEPDLSLITLLKLGPHENFYRDLKQK
tara:strand:- start:1444 stop:1719 length:276 start_codon:yes stop_codon:yes gene_type:complete